MGKEDDLQEIVQLVGKDSLSEDQKCTLEVAKIIREDFLQQNGFTDYDMLCPLAKTIGMGKVIVGFHDAAQKTMAEFSGEHKIGWNTINNSMKDIIKRITDMKFEMPRQAEDRLEYHQQLDEGHHQEDHRYEVRNAPAARGALQEVVRGLARRSCQCFQEHRRGQVRAKFVSVIFPAGQFSISRSDG